MTSALLQQDVVREVLEDKPAERYRHLGTLLGLDEVREFELAVRRRADRHAAAGKSAREVLARLEQQLRTARNAVETLRAQQAAAADTARARDELTERLLRYVGELRLNVELPAVPTDALFLQNNVRELGDQFTRLMGEVELYQAQRAALSPGDEDQDAAARLASERAAAAAVAAQAAFEKAEASFASAASQSEAIASLATAALPLLGERCPVCQQEISKDEVERHLHELIERGGSDLPRLDEERTAARTKATEAEAQRLQALAQVTAIDERERANARLTSERDRLIAAVHTAVERGTEAGIDFVLRRRLDQLDSSAFGETVEALRALWAAIGDLVGILRALPTGEELAAAEGDMRRLEVLLVETREQTSSASAREEEARTLQRAATRAAAAVTDDRFRLLAPLISDIFSRLDPHPVFKDLDFSLGVYNERGVASPIVRDLELDLEADPLIVFSSSQANVAALSYFLALGWAAGADAMPFVLLDDPLQSLDDVNALGFADLCRHIRQQRQLIVSTHDRRLAGLLERKLAPRSEREGTRVVEFKAWTRRGPQIEQRVVHSQLAEGRDRRLVAADAA
jgi:DNA repair exonuclease SbcCD ATPase subunit